MNIRKTVLDDLPEILKIYEYARQQMKLNGNASQWGDNRPSVETVKNDVLQNNSYVIEWQNTICGVFTFFIGADPCYDRIINGKWLNDACYGVIHRIASNGKTKGIFNACLRFCESKVKNIRIDTHSDNLIMQHLLEKNGYKKCGIIFVDNGTARLAYQKIID